MERWFLKWSLNFHNVTCPWLLLLLKKSFLFVLSSIISFLILTKCCSSHKAFLNSLVMVSCTCPCCPGVHIPMVRMLGLVGGGRDDEGYTWPHFLLRPGAPWQEQPALLVSGSPTSGVIPDIHLKVHAVRKPIRSGKGKQCIPQRSRGSVSSGL